MDDHGFDQIEATLRRRFEAGFELLVENCAEKVRVAVRSSPHAAAPGTGSAADQIGQLDDVPAPRGGLRAGLHCGGARVGGLFWPSDIPQAWSYFRAIGEPGQWSQPSTNCR
jgi:hypothetical protein